MNCLNCGKDSPLTWKRYFKHPFGNHICLHCGQKLKFKKTRAYRVWFWSWFLILALCAIFIESDVIFYTLFTALILAYLPIDKKMESELETCPRLTQNKSVIYARKKRVLGRLPRCSSRPIHRR